MRILFILLVFNFSFMASAQMKKFINHTAIDHKIKPGDNFFQYASGNGLRKMVIPMDQNMWGGFQTLEIETLNKLRLVFEKSLKENHPLGSLEQKIAGFYFSAMDTQAINKAGYAPLARTIEKINKIKNHEDLLQVIAEGYKQGEMSILGFSVVSDAKNSNQNIAGFYQSGLDLEKEDYNTKDSSTAKARNSLYHYAATIFKLLGEDQNSAIQKATYVLDFETKLSAGHLSNVEARNPELSYHKMAIYDASNLTPNIDWNKLLASMNIHTNSINIAHPKYFEVLDYLLATEPIDAWKAKLQFDYVNNKAWFLSNDFIQAKFDFFKVRWAWESIWDRWKTMIWYTNSYLSDLVGELYVEEYFNPEAKRRIESMVDNVQRSFQERIESLDWMSAITKQKALNKLSGVIKKIGYPDKWKNYDDVVIVKDDLMSNLESIERHSYRNMLSKIDKPVDRSEWIAPVTSVGGYYNAYANEIGLPAGGLQLPFFHPDADDAFNYGATGTIIGHELIHGFDDQGKKFDDKGNLVDWWTQKDDEKYQVKAKALVHQYNQYRLFDSIPVNGELTLGENIADLGGVTIAYEAFKKTQQYKTQNKIDGLTPDQRFFLAFAQANMVIARPELQRRLITIEPHPPVEFRINGILSNFAPFYKAFNVSPDNRMFRSEQDRIIIW